MRPTLLVPVLLATTLSGCTASQPLPTRVQVRDAATHAPIANADISSVALNLYMPTWHDTLGLGPGATVGPTGNPGAARTTTDQHGNAIITLADQRPNQVYISAAGYLPLRLVVQVGKGEIHRPMDWSSGEPTLAHAPTMPEGTLEASFVADNATP